MTRPKAMCTFDALLCFIAGFLMTRQKCANLMHYYVEKQVFSWCAKNCIFDALLRGKAGFLMMHQKGANLLHYYVEKQAFSWCAKNSYIWCIYTWKSRFSYDLTENKVYSWCIITFPSRFFHDAPKLLYLLHCYVEKQVISWRAKNSKFDALLIFDALIRGKAGFLMTPPKTKCTFDALLCL